MTFPLRPTPRRAPLHRLRRLAPQGLPTHPRVRRSAATLGVPLLLAAVVTASSPGWTTYTIQRGDTLSAIAARYGTTVGRLVKANDLRGSASTIYAGETLRVPGARRAGGRGATTAVRHTVRSGETVSALAVRYGATSGAIIRANRLSATGFIRAGEVLRIPVRRSTATSANTFAGRTYPQATVDAAAANRAELASRPAPSRDYVRRLIERTALHHGVDPALALAVSWQESGWDQTRVSVANAIGAMQVIPASGDWASSIVGRRLDLLDVEDNVTAGVVILRVLRQAAGDERRAVASYYQGLTSVRENGMFRDTKAYVASVLALKRRFG